MQVVANDLHVRPFARDTLLEITRHLLAVRVILVDQKYLLDLGLVFHEGGQRLHLHGRVRVQPEVPVIAFLVGQRRVDRGIVQVHQLLARITLVVFGHSVGNCQRGTRAITLHDVANALVNGRLEGVQAFLRRALVVKADHFEFDTRRILRATETLGHELPALELVLSGAGERTGQRVHERHLDGFALLCHRGCAAS